MEIDLTIYFVGKCFFVPDPDGRVTPTKAMYVLLPVCDHMPHVATLCVNNAYRPGARPWTHVSMERSVLRLGGSPLFSLDMPENIADAGFVANAPINTETLKGDPHGLLNARVELTSGEAGGSFPGAMWHYPEPGAPEGPQEITFVTSWIFSQLTVPDKTLVLTFTPLGGTTAPAPLTLTPNNGKIEAWVYSTLGEDLPDTDGPANPIRPPITIPAVGSPAPHFAAYYNLFEDPENTTVVPRFASSIVGGGSPFTCLTARSQLTPLPLPL